MIYILTAASVFVGEYFLKKHIEKTRNVGEYTAVLNGKLLIRRYHNKGAFLNLGEKQSSLVCALSVGLMVFCTGIFICTLTGKGKALFKAGLSLLLGGGFSNTYDRLTRRYVLDYFSFRTGIKTLDRVVFNLADFAIMIGAMCAVLGA